MAATALRNGQLVILPTDTVYGVFCRADASRELLRLRSDAPAAPTTWHAHSVEATIETLQVRMPVHQHILRVLAPGPVRFLIEQSSKTMRSVLDLHPTLPTTLPDAVLPTDPSHASLEPIWSVRVPDHHICQEVLKLAAVPVVADRLSGLPGLGDGTRLPDDLAALTTAAHALGISTFLNAGPSRHGTGSSSVRLTRDGWWRFESAGAFSEAEVRARVETSILFVCTGNTCRSPMAEAIARHLLAKPGVTLKPTRVASAGISAFDGDPMTLEARDALQGLGIKPAAGLGQGTASHRASHLTRQMLQSADIIFAMTAAHASRVLELLPTATDSAREAAQAKIVLLDPSGRDIPDPIGGTLADYRTAAQSIAKFVEQRLVERALILSPQRKGILETW